MYKGQRNQNRKVEFLFIYKRVITSYIRVRNYYFCIRKQYLFFVRENYISFCFFCQEN